MALILLIDRLTGGGRSTLILAGVAVSSLMSAGVNLLITLRPEMERALRIAWLPQSLPAVRVRVSALTAHGRYARNRRGWTAGGQADWAAVERAMELADVAHLANRMADTLSGGERARAYLAMALAQESDYLLLDEPASELDLPH